MTAPEIARAAPTRIAAITRGSLMPMMTAWDCDSPLPIIVLIISEMGIFREPALIAKSAITIVAITEIANTCFFRLMKALYSSS
jgi:hypothetical protein